MFVILRFHIMLRLLALPLLTLMSAFIISAFVSKSEPATAKTADKISYPEHLTGTFTGGFGEENCRSCHFDYDLNPDGGALSVSGLPENISAGETVDIQITLEREQLGAAGFQLSARYEDGSQAGRFSIEENDRIMFSEAVPDSLQYVQHSDESTKPSEVNTNSWTIKWEAPEYSEEVIIFNIAANAANGDMSEFGDFIYVEEMKAEF